MLRAGDVAPDFTVGGTTLYELLAHSRVVIFFFPKAFTSG
jgi:peroxiredoxin